MTKSGGPPECTRSHATTRTSVISWFSQIFSVSDEGLKNCNVLSCFRLWKKSNSRETVIITESNNWRVFGRRPVQIMSSFALMSICLYQLIISDKLLINSGLLHRLQLTLYIKIWCCFISPTDPALLFIDFFWGSCFCWLTVVSIIFLCSVTYYHCLLWARVVCDSITSSPRLPWSSSLARPTPLCVLHYFSLSCLLSARCFAGASGAPNEVAVNWKQTKLPHSE